MLPQSPPSITNDERTLRAPVAYVKLEEMRRDEAPPEAEPADGTGHLEGAAVATVRLLTDAGNNIARTRWSQKLQVEAPAGTKGWASRRAFDCPGGGLYGVTITRPRGEQIEREFFVQEGEERQETISLRCLRTSTSGGSNTRATCGRIPMSAKLKAVWRRFPSRAICGSTA